jgi:hypothetical protein
MNGQGHLDTLPDGVNVMNGHGYAWMGDDLVRETIVSLKQEHDIIVMNCHAGAEELTAPLPELRNLYHQFVHLGVDVIIGHHPHVVQGHERYNGAWIFYSLGNFAFDSIKDSNVPYHPRSIGVVLEIKENNSMEISVIPTNYYKGQVCLCDTMEWTQEIERRNQELADSRRYWETIDSFCVGQFNGTYRSYYQFAGEGNLISDWWLWHNIAIESHRWVVLRALELKMGVSATSFETIFRIVHDLNHEWGHLFPENELSVKCLCYMRLNKVLRSGNAYIWGAGRFGKLALDLINTLWPRINVIGFIDKDKTGFHEGVPIIRPKRIRFSDVDWFFIGFYDKRGAVIDFLEGKGFPRNQKTWILP